jgi:hypothetical protein
MPEKESVLTSEGINSNEQINDLPASCSTVDSDDLGSNFPMTFCKEWKSLFDFEDKSLDISVNYPFTLVFQVKYPAFVDLIDDLNTARVFVGIKHPQKEFKESIELGIYMGRLYLNDLFDVVNIPKDKLVEGVKIVLEAIPGLANGKCCTILKVVDLAGVEITAIRTRRYLMTDWPGGISTGAHFKSIFIKGIQP